jgi:hypothetical protein
MLTFDHYTSSYTLDKRQRKRREGLVFMRLSEMVNCGTGIFSKILALVKSFAKGEERQEKRGAKGKELTLYWNTQNLAGVYIVHEKTFASTISSSCSFCGERKSRKTCSAYILGKVWPNFKSGINY